MNKYALIAHYKYESAYVLGKVTVHVLHSNLDENGKNVYLVD